MSYTQFGYTYPPSSQLLMTGQHPATATPCCQPASPAVVEPPYAAGGAPQPTPAAAVCSLPAAYDSRLLSSFPRLATGLNGLYATSASTAYAAADPQGYVTAAALAAGTNPSFYSSLPNPYDLKESRGAWAPLSQGTAAACYSYDPTGLAAYGPYGDRYGSMDSVARRKNATRETTNTLKAWLYEHRKNPYPTKGEKIMLAIITKMTLTQVSTWFANARRRLKKENKMTWEPRNKSADSADADDKEEEDDDDNNSSSPSPLSTACDVRKKSHDDSCADDEDSQELRVKTELTSSERIKTSDFSSCSVKTESTELGPTSDCLALNVGSYASEHHQTSIMSCSPEPDYHHRQPRSPLSPPQCSGTRQPPPLHHRHFDERSSHHPPSHHHPLSRRPFHHPSAHQHHGTPHHQPGTSPTSGSLCETDSLLTDDRPKIWSLAHTATSDSPPTPVKRLGNTPPPPLTRQFLSSSSSGEDPYTIDCNSPKTTPPPNAAHPTLPGGYPCGGGLPSHAPSEHDGVQRSRWLNGGRSGDCARTVADCDGNKRNRYGNSILGSYVGTDHGRYNGDGNPQATNYSLNSTPSGCFSPSRNPPGPALFESCLESPSTAASRTQTYQNDVAIVGSTSQSSAYLGGTDVNSSSSSPSPSTGHRLPPAPPSSTSSCDYALHHPSPHGPVHQLHRKPPPYGNGDTNNIPPRPPIGEYVLDNSSSGQGKHMRPEKDELLSPENLGMAPASCLNIIR